VTTVVGLQGPNWAVVGADTRIAEDSRIFSMPKGTGKIIRKEGYIVALAGDFRPAQIFAHQFDFPKPPAYTTVETLDKFMTVDFLPLVQEAYKEVGYEVKNVEEGTDLIVATQGTIYNIGADSTWARDRRGIYAIGTGSAYAIGAIAAFGIPKSVDDAVSIVKQALHIATDYDSNSGQPVIIHQQVRA
jgi:ATP-dependent protease HslVU (ClpYQ) peptidase subunit